MTDCPLVNLDMNHYANDYVYGIARETVYVYVSQIVGFLFLHAPELCVTQYIGLY